MPSMQQYELDQFGVVRTDKRRYAPLEEARITFECRSSPSSAHHGRVCALASTFVVKVYDGAGRSYFRTTVTTSDGVAKFTVPVGGVPGLHIIRVFKEGANEAAFHASRMGSFVLAPETGAWADRTDMDEFFRWLRESLEGSLDWALYGGQWVAGDKAGDNSPMNLAYPRFRLDSSVYFE
ncbi:MAG: hypothetical protein FJ279_38195, partial [Planctomycetes bacterium]|nr:hypothetical protein [Planctomycetota bacterium]